MERYRDRETHRDILETGIIERHGGEMTCVELAETSLSFPPFFATAAAVGLPLTCTMGLGESLA